MLTYLEPCGWCSSSISSTKCPSNVDKSTKPCSNLSSSLDSRSSSISNSDSISISTDSISYGKRTQTSTCLVRSSVGHPNDYYTTKRIDELHERMDDIQISSFLKFINYHLALKKDHENLHINDLIKDLSNGHILIDLIEILSSTKLKREYGHTRFHSLTNVQYVIDYLKLHMQHINISPHEIVSGNRKQILALLWIIMKIFDFPGFRIINKNCFVENTLLGFGQDRSIILKWLNHIINQSLHTQEIHIKDFYIQTWSNGYYLSIIIKYLIPLSIKHLTIKCFDYLKELDNINLFDKQRFQICLNLSNYCFNTITIIDYMDKSEKSLFKYFTELQLNILNILKTNHIGKLIQNNPYTKQIIDTIIQTTEHSSHIINDNEQYLVCIEEEKKKNSMNESANLRTVEKSRLLNAEQEKMKLKRKNRWEKTENVQSNSHMTNGHHETSKEEQIEEITDKSQQLNGTIEKIKQEINDQPIATTQYLEQITSTIEPLIVTDKETEQITVTNVESQINGMLEQPTIEVQEPQHLIRSNEENNNEKLEQEDIEQSIENKNSTIIYEKLEHFTSTIEEPTQSVVLNGELEQVATEEPQQQIIGSNEGSKQSINEHEKLEQPIENKPSNTTNERLEQLTSEESLQSVILNQEDTSTSIENNHYVSINENLEQPTIAESSQPLLSSKNEQNTIKVIDNENSVTSNGKLEQPRIDLEKTKHLPVEHEELHQSPASIATAKQLIENKSLESSSCLVSNKTSEQTPVTIAKNNPITINKKLEQSTINESLQAIIPNEKTTITSVENNSSIMTSKKLEKPAVIESQQPIALNGQINKPAPLNKKSTATTKKSIPTVSSVQENQHSLTSNEQPTQSTIVVKEPEQRKIAVELPVKATATTFRCSKYSDVVNKQTSKTNNESVQGTVSSKRQEYSTVSKKKAISPVMSSEKPKQTPITAEETEQVAFTSTIKESEQFEESCASAVSNEDTKKSSTKNKKSRRSNAKKGKAKNSTVKNKNPQEPVINNEDEEKEEVEPSLPPFNVTNIVQEQKTNSEIQNSSTIPKTASDDNTSINNENSQNSSALRSRKNKKKKTTATTTTTLIEKSSSSLIPTTTTPSSPNRNLFIIIKESIYDRKHIAFKCVIILFCLCFSIIIIVHSHK